MFLVVRSERQQMLICIDDVKQKKWEEKEEKKLFFSCRHFMAWIVVTLPFSGLSIASGKRKLYEVKEWWEENEEREREKGTVLVTRKKREIMVVTSQNHVCFLNHTLCVLIPFERSLFRHSFCIILSYNFIIHTLEYNSSPYHNKPNIKTCYYDFIFLLFLEENV
jgi:hypothetical protein